MERTWKAVAFREYGVLGQEEAGAWDDPGPVTRRLPPDELRSRGGKIHGLSLREGDVWSSETSPGVWTVMWYPHRRDHPDWPSLTIDSQREAIPTEGGSDAVLEWARDHFRRRDERDFAEALIDSLATPDEVAATERAFDEVGFPVIVNPALEFRSRYPELIPWTLVLKAPLTAFLTALAAKAGADACDSLRRLVGQLAESRGARRGQVKIEEAEREIVLTTETPEDALRLLARGQIPESGYVLWDDDAKVWRRH